MPDESESAGFPIREGTAATVKGWDEIAGVADVLQTAARVSFRVLIVLIPFRARLVLRPVEIGSLYSDYTDVILYLTDVVGLLTLLMWGGSLLAARRKPTTGPWLLTWPLAGLLVSAVISSSNSVSPEISWYHVVRLAGLFALYLYALNEVETLDELRIPVAVMVGFQAVVAVAQFLVQRSLGLVFLGELALDPTQPGASIVWAPGILSLRSYGLTDHPNLLGGALALGLILLFAAYLQDPAERRIQLAGPILLGLIALLFSFSRSAWVGLAAGAALILAWTLTRDRGRTGPLVVLGATAAFVLLPFALAAAPYLSSRLGIGTEVRLNDPEYRSPENRSLAERALLNDAANAMFIENPISGVGIGAFPVALQEQSPDFEYDYQPAHFVLLLAAAETGLLGALFYFLAITFPWVALWLSRNEPGLRLDFAAASAALAGVIVIGLFDYYPWLLAPGRLWHWILWGIWAGLYQRRRRSDG